jgi:NAD(P)-dependent dehydrogenase (short-subunit alcohol dehydrogenase family)
MKLKGQVAIVTGAGRNIGEAIAKLFATEGAKVAIVDMDKARGERVAGDIVAAGGEAAGFVVDVSKGADVAAGVAAVTKHFGRVDILVNNVAISDNKTILDLSEEEWDRVMSVTLKGPFLMGKHAAQQMIAQNSGGKIVNIASTSGFRGRRRAIAYTSAKGGVINLTRSMAVQLAPYNIRVNSVSPNKAGSPVGKDEPDSDRLINNLLKRLVEPIDVARAVLFLVSDDSAFVLGENIFVDGGIMAVDVPMP